MKKITLKNLASSTTLEVFNYVKHHLLTQNKCSTNNDVFREGSTK